MKSTTILTIALLTALTISAQTKKKKLLPPPPPPPMIECSPRVKETVTEPALPLIDASPMRIAESTNNRFSNNKILTEYDFVTGDQFKPLEKVALDKNAIIIYDYDGTVKSFNLETQKINWNFKAKDEAVTYSRNKFTLEDGVLYIPFINGEMYALNHKTGEKFWELKAGLKNSEYIKIWINQIPKINNNLIYITSQYENSNIYAFDKRTGYSVWNYKLQYPYNHIPVLYTNDKVFTQNAPYIYSFDANTGELLNRRNFDIAMYTTPTSDGKLVFVANERNTVYALNPNTLETVWEVELAERAIGTKIFTKGDKLYLATNNTFYALDTKSGKTIWQTKVTEEGQAAIEQLEEFNNRIYAYNKKGTLFQLDLNTGKILQTINLKSKPISNIEVLDDSTLYYYCEAGLIKLTLATQTEDLIYMRNAINENARENYIKLVR